MKQTEQFNDFLQNNLNNQQQKAVKHKKGSLLVIAGAGSGKTRVITARIAHLIINRSVLPSQILALTFTNKAAREMKERVTRFLGPNKRIPFIGTFHSYCLQLLKKNQELLDQPFFSILDGEDQKKLLQRIIKQHGLQKKTNAKQMSYYISQLKNKKIETDSSVVDPLFEGIYRAYEQEKTASKCLDFDDLLLEILCLFEKEKAFKKSFQQDIRHILIDEYQDTNVVQHALLKQMAKKSRSFTIDSLCAVGDEDQSIYSWRGATVANIINFTKDFPKTTTIKIEQNYRSVQSILTLANQVIKQNQQRNPKKLWSEKKGTDRIRTLSCVSEYQEGEAIAQFVTTENQRDASAQLAVLYRTHFQSRAIEEALIKNSIPYKIIGGIQFYERKEIKDILAYLRLLINPFDRASFFRVINCPSRGLGTKFEEQFHARWQQEPFHTFKDVAQELFAVLPKLKKESVTSFINVFNDLNSMQPHDAVEHIIKRTCYLQHLKGTYEPEDATARIENINELLHAISHFQTQGIVTIQDFLDEVALMQDHQLRNQDPLNSAWQFPVLLMTLHAAKGLEFDTVILAGLEDGLLPSSRSLQNEQAIEEERRLFYVGITRAKERLVITRSRYRYTFGTMADQRPSRFLKEIPSLLIPLQDASYWNSSQMRLFFADWLQLKTEFNTEVFTFGTAQQAKKFKQKKNNKEKIAKKTGSFKKNQPVSHTTFGIGIVQKIEKRANKKIYITAKFKKGIKKIDAQFLKPL